MENKKVIKLNVKYVDFVEKVIKEKLINKGVEELRSMYLNNVGVKSYVNIRKVDFRVKREKLKKVLSEILKEKGIKLEEFNKVSNEIVEKIRESKNSNYIVVE